MNKMRAQMQKSKRKPQDMARMEKNSTLYVWILTCWQLAGNLLDYVARRALVSMKLVQHSVLKCVFSVNLPCSCHTWLVLILARLVSRPLVSFSAHKRLFLHNSGNFSSTELVFKPTWLVTSASDDFNKGLENKDLAI
jgi:hypothetical protein